MKKHRFLASGSPGTVLEVPGDGFETIRQADLTKLSAQTAPGEPKPTISDKTVNKNSDWRPKGSDSSRDCHKKMRRESRQEAKIIEIDQTVS